MLFNASKRGYTEKKTKIAAFPVKYKKNFLGLLFLEDRFFFRRLQAAVERHWKNKKNGWSFVSLFFTETYKPNYLIPSQRKIFRIIYSIYKKRKCI